MRTVLPGDALPRLAIDLDELLGQERGEGKSRPFGFVDRNPLLPVEAAPDQVADAGGVGVQIRRLREKLGAAVGPELFGLLAAGLVERHPLVAVAVALARAKWFLPMAKV